MKPIEIEFISRKHWLWIWTGCAAIAVSVVCGAVWPLWQVYRRADETTRSIDQLQQKLLSIGTPLPPTKDPQYASAAQAARLLQVDLNPMFTEIENLQQPGAKLRSWSVDLTSGVIRIEYSVASTAVAVDVTALLNAGYEARPWSLDSLNINSGGLGGGQELRAIWSGRLALLAQ